MTVRTVRGFLGAGRAATACAASKEKSRSDGGSGFLRFNEPNDSLVALASFDVDARRQLAPVLIRYGHLRHRPLFEVAADFGRFIPENRCLVSVSFLDRQRLRGIVHLGDCPRYRSLHALVVVGSKGNRREAQHQCQRNCERFFHYRFSFRESDGLPVARTVMSWAQMRACKIRAGHSGRDWFSSKGDNRVDLSQLSRKGDATYSPLLESPAGEEDDGIETEIRQRGPRVRNVVESRLEAPALLLRDSSPNAETSLQQEIETAVDLDEPREIGPAKTGADRDVRLDAAVAEVEAPSQRQPTQHVASRREVHGGMGFGAVLQTLRQHVAERGLDQDEPLVGPSVIDMNRKSIAGRERPLRTILGCR